MYLEHFPALFRIPDLKRSSINLLTSIILFFGGGKRDRTDDLMLAKHALSQLSYTPIFHFNKNSKIFLKFSGGDGRNRTDDLMLAEHALSQLSYIPFKHLFITNHQVFWWAREDLNLRPHAYQACALTN